MATRRALHFVFKVGDRPQTAKFYKDVLGMKFLRHEEFVQGCEASCNGPYDGHWSKSMVGYGPEDDHFVVELTYNYGIGGYKLGNDFRGITVHSKSVLPNAAALSWPVGEEGEQKYVTAPDGYKFYVVEKDVIGDPVKKVSLSCSNLATSIEYWTKLCGMQIFSQTQNSAEMGFSQDQCHLELVQILQPVDHATAFGRIAFSCPAHELPNIEKEMTTSGQKILTPLISLPTPGKATVQVVILADPDGHEICFVGDEAFRELSQVDSKADELLAQALKEDKSDEWFSKKKQGKPTA